MSEPWAEQTAMVALGAEESYQDLTFRAVVAAIEGARDAGAHDALEALEKARKRASKAETLIGAMLDWIERHETDPIPPQALIWECREIAQRTPNHRGVAGDRCEAGNECGRIGCPECQS
jgi:hypothetical protein